MSDIRVLLVDDHAVLRAGLRSLLEGQDDIDVVGEAESAAEALEKVGSLRPSIVVMDLGMPGLSAFEAIREIGAEHPDASVIVLSMHKGKEIVTKALESGAQGYVPKSSAHSDLLRAIRTVDSGRAYLHPSATTVLVDAMRDEGKAQVLLTTLSDREREVMRWTARGFSSREIGDRLSISGKTVDTYRSRLMQKLRLEHRSELVDLAYRAGMLGWDEIEG
ncbi:MAG: response regulator transcription factor [Anaerolineales bacterium]|nr:response regulator transcription factor [Anaerolineales bacterium]